MNSFNKLDLRDQGWKCRNMQGAAPRLRPRISKQIKSFHRSEFLKDLPI